MSIHDIGPCAGPAQADPASWPLSAPLSVIGGIPPASRSAMTFARLLRVGLLLSSLIATPVRADTFQVTRADDPAPNGCLAADCSLREALEAAQATPAADTIRLGSGQYFVTRGHLDAFGTIVLEGAGSEQTAIIASGATSSLRVAAHSDFTLRGIRLVPNGGTAIKADRNQTSTTLEDVELALAAVEIVAGDAGDVGDVRMRVRHSRIAGIVGCLAATGLCEVTDSVVGSVGAIGERVALRIARSEVVDAQTGVIVFGAGEVAIGDSTIRNSARPLELRQVGTPDAADVWIRRTRFVGNSGPILGTRDGTIHLDDVEFRDNIVAGEPLAAGAPAVLLAESGSVWRINRALFVGNRGGSGLDGAVVRVLGGANVAMNQVTFADNRFHPDAPAGYGHTIGVYANSASPTILWMFHATMSAAPSLPAGTQGSLLTVRGGNANVRLFNSLVAGTCAFGSGGVLFQAEGNIESPASSCGLDAASNRSNVSAALIRLSPLAENGGFTRTRMPNAGSALLDQASSTWCLFSPVDQRRYLRPAGGTASNNGAVEAAAGADTIFEHGFDS